MMRAENMRDILFKWNARKSIFALFVVQIRGKDWRDG
jgi:hypothetical protein